MSASSDADIVRREHERFEAVRMTIEELQREAHNMADVITRGSVQSHLSRLESEYECTNADSGM